MNEINVLGSLCCPEAPKEQIQGHVERRRRVVADEESQFLLRLQFSSSPQFSYQYVMFQLWFVDKHRRLSSQPHDNQNKSVGSSWKLIETLTSFSSSSSFRVLGDLISFRIPLTVQAHGCVLKFNLYPYFNMVGTSLHVASFIGWQCLPWWNNLIMIFSGLIYFDIQQSGL